jgi:hypothetical protein
MGIHLLNVIDIKPNPGKPKRLVSASGAHIISKEKEDVYTQKLKDGKLNPKPPKNT